jgi:hypothetical protein
MARDRFLLASRSRCHATPLFIKRMKDRGSPTIAPRLKHARALPMVSLGHEAPGAVWARLLCMAHHQALLPILFSPHDFCKDPGALLGPVTACDSQGPKTFGMLGTQLSCHRLHTSPLALPVQVARALTLTDPRLATPRNQAGQGARQHAMIKRLVGLRKVPLGLPLPHHLDNALCSFPLNTLGHLVMAHGQPPFPSVIHVRVACLSWRWPVGLLSGELKRVLDAPLKTITARAGRPHGCHDRLQERCPMRNLVIRPPDAIDCWSALVMCAGPITSAHSAAGPTGIACNLSTMPRHHCVVIPACLKHASLHGASGRGLPVPYLEVIDPLSRLMRTHDEPGDRAANMRNAFCASDNPPKLGHPLGNRLRHARAG